MFKEKKKLVVVYKNKDEMAFNYLKKLIETKDDVDGRIVGTEDGTVTVIGWTEKVYKDNKIKGNISNKIIILDDVKGVNNLLPILDVKFSERGIIYGFAGNQAVISVDENKLQDDREFIKFQKKFDEMMKKINENAKKKDHNKELNLHQGAEFSKIIAVALTVMYPVVGIPFVVGAAVTDSIDRKNLREKMFLYAITKFYLEEIDAFMKA